MNKTRQCFFVTLEGIDGSGKTSAQGVIAQELETKGYKVVSMREPGSTELAEKIRAILMYEKMDGKTNMLLFLASRANLVHDVLTKYRDEKVIILCDRFIDSTMVYQAHMQGYDKDFVGKLNDFIIEDFTPDLTLWFAVDVGIALERSYTDNGRELTIYDKQDTEYFKKAHEGYKEIHSKESRLKYIDANQTKTNVVIDCMKEITEKLQQKGW